MGRKPKLTLTEVMLLRIFRVADILARVESDSFTYSHSTSGEQQPARSTPENTDEAI